MSEPTLFKKAVDMLDGYTWRPHPTSEETILYHYTDSGGLKGIVEDRALRLSDSRHLNDQREQLEAREATIEALKWLVGRFPDEPKLAAKAILEAFSSAENQSSPRKDFLFVGCFSKADDDLSQWRSYGKGEGGFAIGFKASKLLNLANAELVGDGFRLLPCSYDTSTYKTSIVQAIELAETEFSALSSSQGKQVALSELFRRVAWYGSALKNPAFKSEQEWRLIYHRIPSMSPDINIEHLANRTFKPYIKLEFGDKFLNAIHEVVIGPQRHMELAKEGLFSFFETKFRSSPTLRLSSVPFRTID